MAYTVGKQFTVYGDQRTVILDITADAATQAVETGLDYIVGFTVGLQSGASAPIMIRHNVDASGTAAQGTLGISGAASGDEFFVVCYGR